MTQQKVTALAKQEYNFGALHISSPAQIMPVAVEIANQLASVIKEKKLYKMINGREHVYVEAWTTMGALLGIVPLHDESKSLRFEDGGFKETVDLIRVSDGMKVGSGTSICGTKDEPIWNKRPAFQRMSMAITRATGKAYRLKFSWIMKLAGYEATPVEELDDENGHDGNGHQKSQSNPQGDQTKAKRKQAAPSSVKPGPNPSQGDIEDAEIVTETEGREEAGQNNSDRKITGDEWQDLMRIANETRDPLNEPFRANRLWGLVQRVYGCKVTGKELTLKKVEKIKSVWFTAWQNGTWEELEEKIDQKLEEKEHEI